MGANNNEKQTEHPMFYRIGLTLVRAIEWLNECIGKTVSWLTLAMVLITFLIVVLRYAFNLGWIALQESVSWMHALVFMLGAAYTLKHEGHVRVDIIYQRGTATTRAWIDLLGTLLLLMPVCLFVLWSSWDYVTQSWANAEGSGEAGGLPALYVLKTSILVLGVLLFLQGIAVALRSTMILAGTPVDGET